MFNEMPITAGSFVPVLLQGPSFDPHVFCMFSLFLLFTLARVVIEISFMDVKKH